MKKRLFAFVGVLVSACMLFGAAACAPKEQIVYSNPQVLAEGDGYPILKEEYKGQIKLKMMGANNAAINSDWSKNKFFTRMKDLTGVDFDFEVYGDDMYKEKKNLALTTGDNLPDVFFRANFSNYDEITYGGKTLRALNDLIDGYAPNIKKLLEENPVVRKSITATDGKIYALPTIYTNLPNGIENQMRGFFWINQDWLTELNLDMPKTPDEFLSVMRAFKKNKCTARDAYPLAIAGIDDLLKLFNFFGLDLVEYWVQGEEDGSLTFGPKTEAFKEALAFIRTLYKEGLMNSNWSTFTTTQMSSLGPTGDYYGCFVQAAPQYVVGFGKMKQYTTLDPVSVTGEGGFWGARNPVQRGCFAITNVCRYPELAMRWIDTVYDVNAPYGLWAIIGQEGEEWEWLDEEKTEWKSTVADSEYAAVMATTIIQTGDGMPYAVDETFWGKQQTATDLYTRPLRNKQMMHGRVGYPDVYFNARDLREMSDLAADINSYINRFIASSVSTEGYLEKEWSGFTEFRRLRLDRYLELLKGRYDEFYRTGE